MQTKLITKKARLINLTLNIENRKQNVLQNEPLIVILES